jgi:hypothetical protein
MYKLSPEYSAISRFSVRFFAGDQIWTLKKSSSFAVAGAFQAQKNPRSRILGVLFQRQKRYTSNWPTLKGLGGTT